MMDTRPKTLFIDIDGTLTQHTKLSNTAHPEWPMQPLAGTIDKILEWEAKGYNIILVTGRKECMRESTIAQLARCGIIYDQLIMGIGGGPRVLINDMKPDGSRYAHAINVQRNEGIGGLDL